MTNQSAHGVHPGVILKAELEARGWSQRDLAEILGRPVQAVNEILKQKKSITAATAKGLGHAFDLPAQFWLDLDSQYRLSVEDKTDDDVTRRARLFARSPYADLRKRGWISADGDIEAQELELKRFLRIKKLSDAPSFQFAARKSTDYGEVTSEQEAWCCRARELAESQSVPRFSVRKLREGLTAIRNLAEHVDGVLKVAKLLTSFGIRFVVVEHLPKTKIDGATFWLSKTKPVIALSLRYGRIDYFWFTLFHELSHVLHGDSGVDTNLLAGQDEQTLEIENRANREAAESLVPKDQLLGFTKRARGKIRLSSVIEFADEISVHPGIVLGQLQHRKLVGWSTGRELLVSIREGLIQSGVTDGWGITPEVT